MNGQVVNGSLGTKETHISRIARRKQERMKEELGKLYEQLRNSFIEFLMIDSPIDDTAIQERIRHLNAKWVTFCTIKGIDKKAHPLVKEALDGIYNIYKEKLNQ